MCREVFALECDWDFEDECYTCESKKCGELTILKLSREVEPCTQPGSGGPGPGGPGVN